MEEREYLVTWEIDVDADTYENAARRALDMVANPDSWAHVFTVTVKSRTDATPVLIDLDELDRRD